MSAMDKIVAEFQEEFQVADADDGDAAAPANSSLQQRVRNLPMAAKVKGVVAIFVASLVLTISVAAIGMTAVYNRYLASADLTAAMTRSIDLRSTMGEVRYHAVRYILAEEPASAIAVQAALGDARKDANEIRELVGTQDAGLSAQLVAIEATLDQYGSTFITLRENIDREGRSAESKATAAALSEAGETIYLQTENFEQALQQFRLAHEVEGLQQFFNLVYFVLALAALAFVFLWLGLRYLSRDLGLKISQVTGAMNKLSVGNTDFEIDGSERKDEVGDMVRALDIFKRANARMVRDAKEREERINMERESEAELARERQQRQEEQRQMLASLAARFERTIGEIVGGVAAASSQLRSTAGSMAAAADQGSTQTDSVSRYMGEASRGVTAAAAASDEFAMSIGEISRQAASSAELARKASDSADKADGTIGALAGSAQEVGAIVELIQSIAKRTNLLALNASIEAARGGEAGRGFAVVASEVKELAAQTSRATDEIATKIQAMQQSTHNSVGALRMVSEQIEQLEATAISIASAVDQQSVAGQDLARSIDLAARSTDEVSGSLAEVRETSLATGAAASQVLSSATELEKQSNALHDQVADFLHHVRVGTAE